MKQQPSSEDFVRNHTCLKPPNRNDFQAKPALRFLQLRMNKNKTFHGRSASKSYSSCQNLKVQPEHTYVAASIFENVELGGFQNVECTKS